MRGAVVASIQLFISVAGLAASGVNRAYSKHTDPSGWLVPVCIQAIPPLVLVFGLWALPLSPRWLMSKHRDKDAVAVLRKTRPVRYSAAGGCEQEVAAIHEALENKVDKGSWMELFQGTNLRRTLIAIGVFTFQQFTGQAFASQYGPRFYQTVGLGSQAFNYQLISSGCSIIACLIGLMLIDSFGRRNLVSVFTDMLAQKLTFTSAYHWRCSPSPFPLCHGRPRTQTESEPGRWARYRGLRDPVHCCV